MVCTNLRPFSHQPSCANRGSKQLLAELEKEIDRRKFNVKVEASVCMGHCAKGPNARPIGEPVIHAATIEELGQWLDELPER